MTLYMDPMARVSVYPGVSWHERGSKWVARIRLGDKRRHLGLFENEIDAARAYHEVAANRCREGARPPLIGQCSCEISGAQPCMSAWQTTAVCAEYERERQVALRAAKKSKTDRAYYAANKPAQQQVRRTWYEQNKAVVLARVAVWSDANRDKTAKYTQKYRRSHLREHAARMQRRNAIRRSLPSTLTTEEWSQILDVFDHRCAYCLKPITSTPNMEHVIAVVRGGGFTGDNIVPACRSCNTKKQGLPVFAMLLKRPNSVLRIKRGGC